LCLSDFSVWLCYFLRLIESKTDPFRKGIDIKLFEINIVICPLTAIEKKYVSKRNSKYSVTSASDPFFATDVYEVLTRQYCLEKLEYVLQLCGFDSKSYSGHSFRSGAASSAGKAHVEDHLIKVLGRWKSDSYCRYIKISPPSIKYAQQSLTECWTRGYCVNSVYYMYFKIFFYNWMHIQYINRSNSSCLVFVYDCWYVIIRLYLPYCHDFLIDDILKAIPTSLSFHSWGHSAAFSPEFLNIIKFVSASRHKISLFPQELSSYHHRQFNR
jgi:hypothetical protein